MKKIENSELIALLKSDDIEQNNIAFTYLYNKMYRRIEIKVINSELDNELSLDIFQDCMLALVKELKTRKEALYGNVFSFLDAVSLNLIRKEIRKNFLNKRYRDSVAEPIETYNAAENFSYSGENESLIFRVIEKLGSDCRKLLTMFYVDRESLLKIASSFDLVNEQAAKNKKLKCMYKLKEYVQASGRLHTRLTSGD